MTNQITGKHVLSWLETFTKDFASANFALGELDRLAGDGDFGDNITSALKKANTFVTNEKPKNYRSAFTCIAKGFLDTGGTSGPLFGMFFRAIAKSASAEFATVNELAAGVNSGLELIKGRGGAKVGDNTLIDALEPAARALSAASTEGAPSALTQAATSANDGARTTQEMIARRGRASYVGELARGVADPGAVAVAIFFAAGAKALGGSAPVIDWFNPSI